MLHLERKAEAEQLPKTAKADDVEKPSTEVVSRFTNGRKGSILERYSTRDPRLRSLRSD